MPPTPDPRPDAAPERPVPDSGPDDPIDYDSAERAFEAWKPGRSGSSLRSFDAGARWGYAQAPAAEWAAARDADGLSEVLTAVVEWADAAFPRSTDRGRLEHLRREVAELIRRPDDPLEMADVLMILAHHAHHHRVDLADAVACKLAICKARPLGEPDADGVVEHVRGAAADAPQAHQDARQAVAGPSEHSEGLHGADGGVTG